VIGDAKELLAGLAVFEIPVARGGLVDGMTLTLTISPIGSRSHKIAASAGGGTSAPGLPGVKLWDFAQPTPSIFTLGWNA
jgi:hypothetical protein